MTHDIRLDAYLQRIGYRGACEPTLETLRGLHRQHPRRIAFENLDPLSGRPVRLDPDSLQDKLVSRRRGGYCFEHNLLFAAVLRQLGFSVRGLAARVLWNRPAGTISPRTHMLLQVELDDGGYLADVGFGGLTLTAPLKLIADIEQSTPHEDCRLVSRDDGFIVQARIRREWQSLYWFDPQEHLLPDYEMGNWYVSTHPESLFVNRLLAARAAADCRHALLDNAYTVHRLDGASETRLLTSAAALREVLEKNFGISLADLPNPESLLNRLATANQPER